MNERRPNEEWGERRAEPPPVPVLGYREWNKKSDLQNASSGCVEAGLGFFGYIAASWGLLLMLSASRVSGDAIFACWIVFTGVCLGLSVYAGTRFNNWGWLKGISAVLLLIGGLVGLIWSICGR